MREETEKLKNNRQTLPGQRTIRKKIKEFKVLVENKEKRKKGNAWSKERKPRHAEMMRKYWDKKKAKMRKEMIFAWS